MPLLLAVLTYISAIFSHIFKKMIPCLHLSLGAKYREPDFSSRFSRNKNHSTAFNFFRKSFLLKCRKKSPLTAVYETNKTSSIVTFVVFTSSSL